MICNTWVSTFFGVSKNYTKIHFIFYLSGYLMIRHQNTYMQWKTRSYHISSCIGMYVDIKTYFSTIPWHTDTGNWLRLQNGTPIHLGVLQIYTPKHLDVLQVYTPKHLDVLQIYTPKHLNVLQIYAPNT